MNDIAIKVENLSKLYRIGQLVGYKTLRESLMWVATTPLRRLRSTSHEPSAMSHQPNTIWALKDISFEVKRGEAVGIIGRNGSGKTTLLKILSRITAPTEGYAEVHGRIGSLLEVGTGFHPELTGRENIYLNGAVIGMKKAEVERKFDEIVSFAEIEKFLDTPVKRYSSGMYVRLAFSVAAHLEPEILLVDEVLAVGDAAFQKKCLGKMSNVASEGRTVLFVSHNMAAVLSLCGSGILLEAGEIRGAGSIQHVVDAYLSEAIKLEGEVIFPEDRPRPHTELKFVAVRILDSDGHPKAYVDLLKGFILEIEYEVLQPVRSAEIAFELWNSMGTCVLCSSDLDTNPEDSINTKTPGRYRASCLIEPAYLRPGRYWIDLASNIPNIQVLDQVHSAIALEVVDSGSAESKLSRGRRGIIAPILKWNSERMT